MPPGSRATAGKRRRSADFELTEQDREDLAEGPLAEALSDVRDEADVQRLLVKVAQDDNSSAQSKVQALKAIAELLEKQSSASAHSMSDEQLEAAIFRELLPVARIFDRRESVKRREQRLADVELELAKRRHGEVVAEAITEE